MLSHYRQDPKKISRYATKALEKVGGPSVRCIHDHYASILIAGVNMNDYLDINGYPDDAGIYWEGNQDSLAVAMGVLLSQLYQAMGTHDRDQKRFLRMIMETFQIRNLYFWSNEDVLWDDDAKEIWKPIVYHDKEGHWWSDDNHPTLGSLCHIKEVVDSCLSKAEEKWGASRVLCDPSNTVQEERPEQKESSADFDEEQEESLIEWARTYAPLIYNNSAAMRALITSMRALAPAANNEKEKE